MRRKRREAALVVGLVVTGLGVAALAHWMMNRVASQPLAFPELTPDLTVRIVGGNVNFTETNLPGE